MNDPSCGTCGTIAPAAAISAGHAYATGKYFSMRSSQSSPKRPFITAQDISVACQASAVFGSNTSTTSIGSLTVAVAEFNSSVGGWTVAAKAAAAFAIFA